MPNVKRNYSSPRREAQAAETRRAILWAALELFMSQGFGRTTVRQVAKRAEVSEQTVYNAFGDKIGLLYHGAIEYIGQAGGPDEAEFLAALQAEPNPLARIRMVARNSRETWEGGALELEQMVYGGELQDPRLDELREMALAHKLASTRAVCEVLFPDEIRRDGLTLDQIAAFTTAVDSAATVTTLRALGWSMDQWEAWAVEFLALFLKPR